MASRNARRLDRERYGPEYDRHLRTIAEHDRWSSEQFATFQRESFCDVIRHAAANVSYYRGVFAEAGIDPQSIRGPEDLPRLPILEKQTVRADPLALVDETRDRAGLLLLHTSGTSGTPLDLYRDASLNAAAFAYLDARWHAVAGVRRREHRSVSIGGHLVAAPERTRPPFWVHNRRWNQLYMSSYHLAPRHLADYVEAIRRFRPDYVEGYPSSVYAVARYACDAGLTPVPTRACFTTAETLFDHQRDAIREAFGCRTYNQYGCGEMAVFAAECEKGSMHLSPECGIVEVVDEQDRPLPPGQTGQLLCTSLINRIQLFIRYRLGDMGSLRTEPCACGSTLPCMGTIEGRTDTVLITRDGRRIGRLDPVFKGTRGIAEAQVVQDDYDRFRVRIVPSESYVEADGKAVAAALAERVGGGDIRVEIVPAIERTAAGKFKAVICNVGHEAQAAVGLPSHARP